LKQCIVQIQKAFEAKLENPTNQLWKDATLDNLAFVSAQAPCIYPWYYNWILYAKEFKSLLQVSSEAKQINIAYFIVKRRNYEQIYFWKTFCKRFGTWECDVVLVEWRGSG